MTTRRNKSRRPANPIAQPGLTQMQRSLLEEANRKVTIVVDGQQSEVRVGQVVSRKLLQMAANGSVHALSNAFNEMVLAERQKEAEIEKEVAFGHYYKERQQKLLDRAIEDGLDPDSVLPHPDDILVVDGKGYRILGPDDEFSLNLVRGKCARRDLYILQYVLEERLKPCHDPDTRNGADGDDETDALSSALLLVHFMNHGLPERFRLSGRDIEHAIWRHQRKTKRQLLKEAHRAWAATGQPKPRGWVLPPLSALQAKLDHFIPAFGELYRQVKDGKLVQEHAVADRIREIVRQTE